MTAIASIHKIYTLEEYFVLEEQSAVKHEFDDGKLIEMAGGTINHGLLCGNIITWLNIIFSQKGIQSYYVFGSDVKLWLPAVNKVLYPDVSVLLGTPETYPGRRDVLMNPLIIVEVLSDSTAAYDRGKKFENYCSIPAFREYVLVSQNEPTVEAYYLHDAAAGLWKISRASGLNSKIHLHSAGIELSLESIYRGIAFEETTEPGIAPESL